MADSLQGRGVNASVGTSSTGHHPTTQAQAHKALQQVQVAVQQSQQQIAPPRRHHNIHQTLTQTGQSLATQTVSQVKEGSTSNTTVQQQQQVQCASTVSHSFCLFDKNLLYV